MIIGAQPRIREREYQTQPMRGPLIYICNLIEVRTRLWSTTLYTVRRSLFLGISQIVHSKRKRLERETMSSPLDIGAFGKDSLYSDDLIPSHREFQHPSSPSRQKARNVLEDQPQNHWLNAYLGFRPSSKNHEGTTNADVIRQCGVCHMAKRQGRDNSLGS